MKCVADFLLFVAQGDVIEVMTNGHFKATKYRVVPRNGERAAMEFSARLDPDAVVEPHEAFLVVSRRERGVGWGWGGRSARGVYGSGVARRGCLHACVYCA